MKQKQKKNLSFHNYWQNVIKRELKASFVAWEANDEGLFLKININKSPIYCEVGGTFEDVTSESYAGLLKELLDGTRSLPLIAADKTE